MRLLASSLLLAVTASTASATSHQYYNRTDAQRAEAARSYLDGHGMSNVTVRVFRGRVTLGGALPSDTARLASDIKAATGAASVHF